MSKENIGALTGVVAFVLTASWWVFGYAARIDSNTYSTIDNKQGISEIVLTLEVGRVSSELSDLKKERRFLLKEQRAEPGDEDIASELDEVNDQIDEAMEKKMCILDPLKPICR